MLYQVCLLDLVRLGRGGEGGRRVWLRERSGLEVLVGGVLGEHRALALVGGSERLLLGGRVAHGRLGHGLELELAHGGLLAPGLLGHGRLGHGLELEGMAHGLLVHGLLRHGLLRHGLLVHGRLVYRLLVVALLVEGLVAQGMGAEGLLAQLLGVHGLLRHGLGDGLAHGLAHGLLVTQGRVQRLLVVQRLMEIAGLLHPRGRDALLASRAGQRGRLLLLLGRGRTDGILDILDRVGRRDLGGGRAGEEVMGVGVLCRRLGSVRLGLPVGGGVLRVLRVLSVLRVLRVPGVLGVSGVLGVLLLLGVQEGGRWFARGGVGVVAVMLLLLLLGGRLVRVVSSRPGGEVGLEGMRDHGGPIQLGQQNSTKKKRLIPSIVNRDRGVGRPSGGPGGSGSGVWGYRVWLGSSCWRCRGREGGRAPRRVDCGCGCGCENEKKHRGKRAGDGGSVGLLGREGSLCRGPGTGGHSATDRESGAANHFWTCHLDKSPAGPVRDTGRTPTHPLILQNLVRDRCQVKHLHTYRPLMVCQELAIFMSCACPPPQLVRSPAGW